MTSATRMPTQPLMPTAGFLLPNTRDSLETPANKDLLYPRQRPEYIRDIENNRLSAQQQTALQQLGRSTGSAQTGAC